MRGISSWAIGVALSCAALAHAQGGASGLGTGGLAFQKQRVTSEYHGEGADRADFDKDGILDLVSGPYWYQGPDFQVRHEYQAATVYDPAVHYSKTFFAWAADFNGDQWTDIFTVGVPGAPGYWFQNPGAGAARNARWTKREAVPVLGNESPALADLDGDGKLELLMNTNDGYAGFAAPVAGNPDAPWTFRRITPKGTWERFTHGLGLGDVNGDGRLDLLENTGWWEQPASLAGDPQWRKRSYVFGGRGGAQMFAWDFDGDGDQDIATSLDAHGWGLAWFEQVQQNGAMTFVKHPLMGDRSEEAKYGVAFSQPHALALADLDGDGLMDLVTGKRKWAHGPEGDIEPNAPALLCAFRLKREAGKAVFTPVVLDTASGVGTQLEIKDVSGDGLPDILVGNKNGTFVFRKQGGSSAGRPWRGRHVISPLRGQVRTDVLGLAPVDGGVGKGARLLYPRLPAVPGPAGAK